MMTATRLEIRNGKPGQPMNTKGNTAGNGETNTNRKTPPAAR
jgi:hypothetical protein